VRLAFGVPILFLGRLQLPAFVGVANELSSMEFLDRRLPQQGWIIEMVAYDVSVNAVFFGGADFDPPPPLGTRGRSRYVKLKTLEEAEGPLDAQVDRRGSARARLEIGLSASGTT
jgi:hypothetical protein